jgi:hypothetical protein
LPQVVVAGGQEAFLGALRAVGLLHQPDHLGGQAAVLRRMEFAARQQGLLPPSPGGQERGEFGEGGRVERGWFRIDQRCQAHGFAPRSSRCQDPGRKRARQPAADGDARCQQQLPHRFHGAPGFPFRVGSGHGGGDIPSALAGMRAARA